MLWFTFKFVSLNHWKQQTPCRTYRRWCCDLLSNLYLWTIGNNIIQILPIPHVLWFTFKFVSLNHWKQHIVYGGVFNKSCDLLSNLYLWTIGNNSAPTRRIELLVVIYFQICIFEPLETTSIAALSWPLSLWFTFKFVSLNHWKQPKSTICPKRRSCDLLSNLYLWTIGNNFACNETRRFGVVIYFQICIFEPLETTLLSQADFSSLLWFTFKFVSLNHWKQLIRLASSVTPVVIYFQICIFEPLETTYADDTIYGRRLWFTFKFVSLNHWKQQNERNGNWKLSCDLLSNLYLWTIGNNLTME